MRYTTIVLTDLLLALVGPDISSLNRAIPHIPLDVALPRDYRLHCLVALRPPPCSPFWLSRFLVDASWSQYLRSRLWWQRWSNEPDEGATVGVTEAVHRGRLHRARDTARCGQCWSLGPWSLGLQMMDTNVVWSRPNPGRHPRSTTRRGVAQRCSPGEAR